jgi:hypothetical protein
MKSRNSDRAYLQDLKIDIRAEKDIDYQELSLLFDKKTYLDLLPNLRKTYGIVNLIPVEKYDDYFFNTFLEKYEYSQTKMDLSKYKKLDELKKSINDFYDAVHEETDYPIILEYECYLLCYEFNRPPHFAQAIQQTIFCGTVTRDNFKPTKSEIIEPNSLWYGSTLPPVAIFRLSNFNI